MTDTLTLALKALGCNQARVVQEPPMLSDKRNRAATPRRPSPVCWMYSRTWGQSRGVPDHPQTQGKSIERCIRRSKNPHSAGELLLLVSRSQHRAGSSTTTTTNATTRSSSDNLTPAELALRAEAEQSDWKAKRIKRKHNPKTSLAASKQSRLN